MKKKKKQRKIHKTKSGREYIKHSYFVRGKRKIHKIYLIDGLLPEQYYEQNASDLDFYLNGDYHLMSQPEVDCCERKQEEVDRDFNGQNNEEFELPF